jgi:SAM-dependent methyltransferase
MEQGRPRFSVRVENYIKYRPRYPQAVLDLLRQECQLAPEAVVADMGSGTGLLTELFLKNGNRVFAIEPDPAMRAAAEWLLRGYPGFTSIAATAEATTLADHSIDLLSAGQAFHWFDLERAREEFQRILVPGGWVALVFNLQRTGGTPFLDALEHFWQIYLTREGLETEAASQDLTAYLQQANPVYRWRLSPELAGQELIAPLFRSGDYKLKTFENPQVCDYASLKGRVLSSGTAPEADHPRYAEMIAALERLFQTYQVNGAVKIEYETRVYYGRLFNA